jgi:hypothetical protein
MQFRGLLIGAVLLAVLGGAWYWSNKAEKEKEGKPAPDAAPKIVSIPEDQVKQVEIRKKDAEATVVRKDDSGKWQMSAPKPLPVDQDAMTSMTSTLSSLSSDRLVEEKASDLAAYGLNAPVLVVSITKKDGKTEKILIGDETPTGNGVFAKLEGDPRVFTMATYNKSSLDKGPKDLRDKRLLTFDSDKLTRVELSAKGQPVEFGKNNKNEWAILKPKPLRADGGQVEELVRKLKDAKMDTSVSDEDMKKASSAFAAGTRVAVAKVTDASGTQEIEVRRDKDKNYYAKSSVVEGVHKVGTDLGDGLDKGLDDFRNKKLFDFGFNDPSKIEIRDGAKTTVFQKDGEKWMSASRQMDSTSVQNLIDKLRDLSAAKFVEAGFSAPVFEATVTSNDGKLVEKVQLSKTGSTWYGKRENEPADYELDSNAVTDLQKAAADVKEHQPPKDDKSKKK